MVLPADSHMEASHGRGKTWDCGLMQLLSSLQASVSSSVKWVGKSSLKLLERQVAEEYMVVGASSTQKGQEGSQLN